MKFTLSWLKDPLDTSASLAEIVDALTRVGLEVESVEDPARKYDGFVVGSVVEARRDVASMFRGAKAPARSNPGPQSAALGVRNAISAATGI